MRILMLDNEFPPLGGGMGTLNRDLLGQLAEFSEIEIDLITSTFQERSRQEAFSERITLFKLWVGRTDIHHASNLELMIYAFRALVLSLRLMRNKRYDFCFAWSALPAGGTAWVLRKLTRLPYMVWASGPDIPGFERRYDRLFLVLRPLLKVTWRDAEPLIVKCAEEAALVHAVAPSQKLVTIPNGVDLSRFCAARPLPDDGPLRVVCAARLIERKGQHHLIRAVKTLKDEGLEIEVHLLGTGDALEANRQLAAELGVDDRVHFAGFVQPDEIPARLAEAHLFVLPSYFEGMSLAALEGLATGLPLILTRTGGTGGIVEEGVNGFLFDWGDVEALASHLRFLDANREKARAMGAASRKRAETMSWDTLTNRYLALFASLSQKESNYSG